MGVVMRDGPLLSNFRECLVSGRGEKGTSMQFMVWGALGKVWKQVVKGWELRDGGMGSGVSACSLVQN